MGMIAEKSVTTQVTTVTLSAKDIAALVAADMGVDPEKVNLDFRLVSDSDDSLPGCPTYRFDRLDIKVTS